MDPIQSQQQQQHGATQGHPGPPLIAPKPNGMQQLATANNTPQQAMTNQNQHAMNSHLMGMMTNPALAAAASHLFPPAAMMTNPGAYLAMPDMMTSLGANPQNGQHTIQAASASAQQGVTMQLTTQPNGSNGTTTVYTDALGNQQIRHVHQIQPCHQQQMSSAHVQVAPHPSSTVQYGLQPNQTASSSFAHMAAAAAAAQAVADNDHLYEEQDMMMSNGKRKNMTAAQRAKQNRDRNREHAKSTRLRKKAYIQKLKELVEGLHCERTEEVRQRRVAVQHLAEKQNVRRAVVRSFFRYHSDYEKDKRKWSTLLEDDFWLKQPVTPYRCFRRGEVEQECRMSRGVDAVIADAASTAVMIEGVGSRSTRWMQIKREDFFLKEEERTGIKYMPRNIVQQDGRFQHAVSSLSSSSNSSNGNGSSGEEGSKKQKRSGEQRNQQSSPNNANGNAPNVSSSSQSSQNEGGSPNASGNVPIVSSSSQSSQNGNGRHQKPSGEFHDYHAKPLPDPKLPDSERSSTSASEDCTEECNTSAGEDTKRDVCTDSSSGDDSAAALKDSRPLKRQKHEVNQSLPSVSMNTAGAAATRAGLSYLPPNIAKRGGISHNIRPVVTSMSVARNGNARLSMAPATALPLFTGIGKKSQLPPIPPPGTMMAAVGVPNQAETIVPDVSQAGTGAASQNGVTRSGSEPANGSIQGSAVIISGDVETSSSSNSSNSRPQIRAYYHVNEDDMILMGDILMCPFVFRTQDAVLCGAQAECVMPGMLRGQFSSTNKLQSLEMTYDSMGFMQQLERASGSETIAQIIPGSLEMALSPTASEARVITLAQTPFQIVNVNEAWTKLTKYTQMEVEGLELFKLLQGENSEDHLTSPSYSLEDVLEGRCTCATRLHYDQEDREFVDYVSSYPITNTNDEITHILHICKELSPLQGSVEMQDSVMDEVS